MLIIPAIDLKNGLCVRLEQGDMNRETVFSSNPVEQARKWEQAGAELIHIVDLDGAFEGKPKNRAVVEEICRSVNCAVQLGGGIRGIETAEDYFSAGVEKIVLGSLLLKEPETARKISDKFPNRVLAGIDVKENMVAGDGWLTKSSLTGPELARRLAGWPLAGIIFTDISRDGVMKGVNIEAVREMAQASPFPLTASGGVSSMADLEELFTIKGVTGAITGRAVYDGAIDLADAIRRFRC
jgi:phosphoribosylformimino-5-aminoimidazole carboxamide ribotide isomerase